MENKYIKSLRSSDIGKKVRGTVSIFNYIFREGVITYENGRFYICQNTANGMSCANKLGYKYSWNVMDPLDLISCHIKINFIEWVPKKDEIVLAKYLGNTSLQKAKFICDVGSEYPNRYIIGPIGTLNIAAVKEVFQCKPEWEERKISCHSGYVDFIVKEDGVYFGLAKIPFNKIHELDAIVKEAEEFAKNNEDK